MCLSAVQTLAGIIDAAYPLPENPVQGYKYLQPSAGLQILVSPNMGAAL